MVLNIILIVLSLILCCVIIYIDRERRNWRKLAKDQWKMLDETNDALIEMEEWIDSFWNLP